MNYGVQELALANIDSKLSDSTANASLSLL